jgi:NAD(P)-dependent dehydrogenase (short-subunit alcohol dehydrogenase family)
MIRAVDLDIEVCPSTEHYPELPGFHANAVAFLGSRTHFHATISITREIADPGKGTKCARFLIYPRTTVLDLREKTCVVTGATSGIGKSAARALASLGSHLILAGRDEPAGHQLVRRLRRRSPTSSIEFVRTDLARQEDVRGLADAIARRHERVDVLINNAGARNYAYHETSDGIESTFATNHLGHFLLTCLLVDRLKKAPSARVITVSSSLHSQASAVGTWYLGRADYDGSLAYAKSKLANLMFAYELARRLRHTPITSNALNPGVVATNFERNNGFRRWLGFLVGHGVRRRLISARTAAKAVVYLAASETLATVTGKYFVGEREAESSPASHDAEAARRLWEMSARLTGVAGDRSLHV